LRPVWFCGARLVRSVLRRSGGLPCHRGQAQAGIHFSTLRKSSSRTRVTELPSTPRYRFFSASWHKMLGMPGFRIGTFSRQRFHRRLLALGICLLACALPLLADTPSLLRRVPAASCYCHCEESRVHGGCIKMCESKKYASRWWAKSCAKPHMSTPTHDSHAGPRYPHPGRAEHARL